MGCVQARVSEWSLLTLPNPIPELQHAPLPLKVLWAKEHAPTLPPFAILYLDSLLSLAKSWECIIISFEWGLSCKGNYWVCAHKPMWSHSKNISWKGKVFFKLSLMIFFLKHFFIPWKLSLVTKLERKSKQLNIMEVGNITLRVSMQFYKNNGIVK